MSELRRAARALVETRIERFESRHPLEESKTRLATAMEHVPAPRSSVYASEWREEEGRVLLEARFAPTLKTKRLLQGFSIAMALLVAASVWAVATQEGALKFLLPLFTVLSILALPFVSLGMGSQRAAEESRVLKAIRVALLDEEARPPPQRWKDED